MNNPPDSSPAMQPVARCPSCGHTRGSDHDCDNVFHASPAMQEERTFEELLDAFEGAFPSMPQGWRPNVQERIAKTRAAVLAHYQELEQQGSEWRETATHLKGVLEQANAKISSLKANQITAEAALAIADEWFGCCDCITTEWGTDERKKEYWRLRLLASQATP